MKTLAALFGLLWLCATNAHAQTEGIQILMRESRSGRSTDIQIRMDKNHIRLDNEAQSAVLLFDGTNQVAFVIDQSRRVFQEMSRSELDRMAERLVEQLLAQNPQKLSPEQLRQQADQLVATVSAQSSPQPPPREYVEIARRKVGERECTQYVEDTSLVLRTDPASFGLEPEDLEVLSPRNRFEASLTPPGLSPRPGMFAQTLPFVSGLVDGKPFLGVVLERTNGRGASSQIGIVEVRRESFSSSIFELPAGFQKESPAFPARPGGARTPVIVIPAR